MLHVLCHISTTNNNVIMVKDHKVVKYIMEHVVHQVVKSSRSIRQSEWHNKELK